jgi:hypothetical protein
MLLTENIVLRYREWRDRAIEKPDLVPRMRRLWASERIEPSRSPRGRRHLLAYRHRTALDASRGA